MLIRVVIRLLAYLGVVAIMIHLVIALLFLLILGVYALISEPSEISKEYEMLRAFEPRAPQWFSNGEYIAFSHAGTIYVVDSEGEWLRKVDGGGDDLIGLAFAPSISPDDSRIAYSRYERSGWFPGFRSESWEIFTANPDGSHQVRITDSEEFEIEPVWSPDGTRIAYGAQHKAIQVREYSEKYVHFQTLALYTITPEGSEIRQVAFGGVFQESENRVYGPTWSPDWRHVANLGFQRSLIISRLDDWIEFELGPTLSQPGWSPDGRHIAVSRTRGADAGLEDAFAVEVYAIGPDGPELSETFLLSFAETPLGAKVSWSPDGSEILFGSIVIPVDGSQTRELSLAGHHSSWSPDSSRIAVYTGQHAGVVLYTVDRDGSDARALVESDDNGMLIASEGRLLRLDQETP